MTPTVTSRVADRASRRQWLSEALRDMAILYAVVVLLAVLFAGVRLAQAQATARWPTVPGEIASSGIELTAIPGRAVRYEPAVAITYRYEVAGVAYTGHAISRDRVPVEAGTAEAERLLATYPAGRPVQVYVNPNDADEAFLEVAETGNLFLPAAVLSGLALIAALLSRLIRP